MNYYNIIPQAKLPRNIGGIFTYKSDAELKSGDLAIIEFRKTDILGLVINKIDQATQAGQIKKVKKIIGAAPEFFVDLIKWLSDYYYSSSAFIFDMMTPRPPKQLTIKKIQIQKKSEIISSRLGTNFQNLKARKSQIKYVKKILTGQNGLINTFNLALSAKFIAYYKLIEQEIAQNRSIILLAPAIADLKVILSYMPRIWKDKIILLYSNIYAAKNKYWQSWHKINGSTKRKKSIIIIGTRSALFAPVNNLGLIIFDRAESDDYKQYAQNPRYDARKVAIKIKKLTKCEVKMFSDGVVIL